MKAANYISEGTTDVPEHAHLASDTSLNWDVRAHGPGGSIRRPLTSCAEGVQNWFNVNAEVPYSDGKHNRLNTRQELKKYDPDLYQLIGQYFSEFKISPSKHSTKNRYRI